MVAWATTSASVAVSITSTNRHPELHINAFIISDVILLHAVFSSSITFSYGLCVICVADNPLGGWHLVCCPFRNFKIFHPCVFFLTTVVYCSMSPKKRLNKGDSYKSSGKKVSASAKKKIFKVKKEPAKCWFL
ncbi:hypothetical protein PC121_g19881 [Phytophthora cactorum]|nr:hypothetical protein PC120_g20224 [Phytophthora cactorum]KAG3047732.1 hypothetical protein PC121_g19881 [Phytophthora cactorum]